MKKQTKSFEDIVTIFLVLIIALGIMIGNQPAWSQGSDIVLFEEDFDDGQAQDWELEPGWFVADNMLKGQGHSWAQPMVGPW